MKCRNALPEGWTSFLMDPHVALLPLHPYPSQHTWPRVCPIFPFKAFPFSLVWGLPSLLHRRCKCFHPPPIINIFATIPLISLITKDLTLDHELYLLVFYLSPHQARISSSTFRTMEFFQSTGLWVFGVGLDLGFDAFS